MKTIHLTDEQYNLILDTLLLEGESRGIHRDLREEILRVRTELMQSAQEGDTRRPKWLTESEQKALDTPPAEWDNLVKSMDAIALGALACGLQQITQGVGRAAAYFEARYLGKSHKDGVSRCNRAYAGIRKALGFRYPKQNISF